MDGLKNNIDIVLGDYVAQIGREGYGRATEKGLTYQLIRDKIPPDYFLARSHPRGSSDRRCYFQYI